MIWRGAEGYGEFSVDNGTTTDAVVTLSSDRGAVRKVYSWAGATAQLYGIPDGLYTIFVEDGTGWNSDLQIFTANQTYFKFDELAPFETIDQQGGYEYTIYSVTLHTVVGGSARTVPIDPASIPK